MIKKYEAMETKTYRLGDVLINYDYLRKPLSSMERESFKGEYPYYGAQGIIDYVKDYLCDGEYMLIAEDGENLSSRKEPIANIALGKFWVNNHAHIVKTNELADFKYVYYLLNYSDITGYVTGSAQPKLSQGNLNKIKIQLPPLPTQRRIASILSTYDALIQNYKRQIAALQSAASELYKEWFVRFRFPGYKNAKFDNGLPEGWKVEKLGEIGEIIGGGTPSTEKEEYWNGEIPWLSPADLSDNTNIYVSKGNKNITQLGLAKSSAKMMPKDTVLLSSRAPVGYVALAKNPICTNQGFKSVVCNQSKIKPLYLYFFFKMNTNYLQSIATGATFPELSATMMKKLKVLLPNIKLQEQFVDTISASIIKADLLFDQITNLTTQRDLLLPRLMSGKLSVE